MPQQPLSPGSQSSQVVTPGSESLQRHPQCQAWASTQDNIVPLNLQWQGVLHTQPVCNIIFDMVVPNSPLTVG